MWKSETTKVERKIKKRKKTPKFLDILKKKDSENEKLKYP